jgi:hypothetical protein
MQKVAVVLAFIVGMLANEYYRDKHAVSDMAASMVELKAITATMLELQHVQDYIVTLEQTRCMDVTVFCTENLGKSKLPAMVENVP